MIAMKIKFLTVFMSLMMVNQAYAQFFTISADTLPSKRQKTTISERETNKLSTEDEVYAYLNTDSKWSDSISTEELFPSAQGMEISIERDLPIFANVKKSPLSALLQQRLTVCLPLDLLKLTSDFGYRRDPISHCSRFHDGIDLKCNKALVYSMLPGIVKEVCYSNKGYGNYVILEHGDLECLYGHLSTIAVREGNIVEAGTVVAVSGNTGRSTGPHLHIRLRRNGESIDPNPFISSLNDYINDLQDRIASLKFKEEPDMKLNIANLSKMLERYHVAYPKIVIAQALLETGYFTSRVCWECNNLFGLRRPSDGKYYEFKRWEDSVKAYRDYVQYKYKGGDYFQFLNRIGYAEDKTYVSKVRQIVRTL